MYELPPAALDSSKPASGFGLRDGAVEEVDCKRSAPAVPDPIVLPGPTPFGGYTPFGQFPGEPGGKLRGPVRVAHHTGSSAHGATRASRHSSPVKLFRRRSCRRRCAADPNEPQGAPVLADEEARLTHLCSLGVMDTDADPRFDDITRLVGGPAAGRSRGHCSSTTELGAETT